MSKQPKRSFHFICVAALCGFACVFNMACDPESESKPKPKEQNKPTPQSTLSDAGIVLPAIYDASEPLPVVDAAVDVPVAVDSGLVIDTVDAGAIISFDGGITVDAGSMVFDSGQGDLPVRDGGSDSGIADNGCPTSLLVEPQTAYVVPWGMVYFTVTNGQGPFRFQFKEGIHNGAISYVLGRYTAGATAGVQDVIEIIDEGCGLLAERTVNIVEPITVQPENLWVPPGVSVEINAAGGSGNYRYEMFFNEAGGAVDTITGVYVAPAWDGVSNPPYGLDRVLVRDLLGDFSAVIEIIVDVDAELNAVPARVVLPLGAEYKVEPLGGSGTYALSIDNEGLVFDGTMLQAQMAGSYIVHILDQNTGLTTTMAVDVLSGQQANLGVLGDRQFDNRMLSAGDVNDDGFEDVLLGRWDHDVIYKDDGAVYLFLGNATGFEGSPAQKWHGEKRAFQFGRQIAVAHVLGDERPDLIVGASGARNSDEMERRGGVYIYQGISGGFASEPTRAYFGDKSDDQLGYSVAACDFNGDGYIDLAAGGINIEDEDDVNTQSNQGGIQLYAGSINGLSLLPTQILWGQRLNPSTGGEAAVWEDVSGLNMGRFIKSGDIDNDGKCDLVAVNYAAKTANGRNSDGIISVFKGQEEGSDLLLSNEPALAIAAFDTHDPGKEFGRMLELADINQDGLLDFLVSHHRLNVPNTSGTNHGAFKIFYGEVLSDAAASNYIPSDAPDLIQKGTASWGYSGFHSAVIDVNKDEIPDLFVGHMRRLRGDIIGTGWQARGEIDFFFGPLDQDKLDGPPDWSVKGTDSDDYFSAQFMPVNLSETAAGAPGLVVYAPMHHGPQGQCLGLNQFVSMPPHLRSFEHSNSLLDAGSEANVGDADDDSPTDSGITNNDLFIDCDLEVPDVNEFLFTSDEGTVYLTTEINASANEQEDFDASVVGPVAELGWRLTSAAHNVADLDYFSAVSYEEEEEHFALTYQWPVPGIYELEARVRMSEDDPWATCRFNLNSERPTLAASVMMRQKLETVVNVGSNEFGASVAFLPNFFGLNEPALAIGAPGNGYLANERYKGSVFLYDYQNEAWGSQEVAHVFGFKHHRDWDQFGRQVQAAGDFDGDGYGDLLATLEEGDNRALDTSEGLVYEDSCVSKSGSNHGIAYVFGGGPKSQWQDDADAIHEPLFGVYGFQAGERVTQIAGNFDYNGDGYADFIFSGYWDKDGDDNGYCAGNNCGGYALVHGRPFTATPGETQIICTMDWLEWGRDTGSYMGRALTGIGDINGDGCDEFAVSSTHEDYPLIDQGLIRIVFGWGDNCESTSPSQIVLGPDKSYRYIGYDLDGQHDIDGDGLPDLAIGSPYFRGDDNIQSGAGMVVYGSWLNFLHTFAEPLTAERPSTVHPLGEGGFAPHQEFLGAREDAMAGQGVALIPGGSGFGRAALAVGWRRGEIGNTHRSGGVMVYRSGAGTLLAQEPFLAVSGETDNEDNGLGLSLDGFQVGEKSYLAACGRYGKSMGVDRGSCYVIEIK